MAADSVVVMPDPDTVLWPSEALIKEVMGMEDFKLNCVSADIASEQIGQAVHRTHYQEILKCVRCFFYTNPSWYPIPRAGNVESHI